MVSPGNKREELTEHEAAQERQSGRESETQSPDSANASGEGSLVERIALQELDQLQPKSSEVQEVACLRDRQLPPGCIGKPLPTC